MTCNALPINSPTKQHRKIAIWLQLTRGQHLIGEGIAMHLAKLLDGMSSLPNTSVVVCAPRWSQSTVHDYLTSFGLEQKVAVRFFGLSLMRRSAARGKPRGPRGLSAAVAYVVSTAIAALPAPLANLFGLLLFVPLVIAASSLKILRNIGRRIIRACHGTVASIASEVTYQSMAFFIDYVGNFSLCIVPIGTWTECCRVQRAPVIVQVPDIVFLEFPSLFPDTAAVSEITCNIMRVCAHSRRVISPSQYVRVNHHVRLGIPEEKSVVVPHAPMTCDQYLQDLPNTDTISPREAGIALMRQFCENTAYGAYATDLTHSPSRYRLSRQELSSYSPHSPNSTQRRAPSLRRFAYSPAWFASIVGRGLKNGPILYFPTQIRPYKNVGRLLDAIAIMKSKHNLSPLLALTGEVATDPAMVRSIESQKLHSNVLPLPRLSPTLHAAMYSLADLTLSVSLFEGGFPFLFYESVSVGTPVLLSDIPVVREALPAELQAAMLFDPNSTDALVRSIVNALSIRDSLLSRQTKFYDSVCRDRTWAHVAYDYINAATEAP